MIAAKIGDMFKRAGQGNEAGVAQMIHEFLRVHCAGDGEDGGESADDDGGEYVDEPGSVETLVLRH